MQINIIELSLVIASAFSFAIIFNIGSSSWFSVTKKTPCKIISSMLINDNLTVNRVELTLVEESNGSTKT